MEVDGAPFESDFSVEVGLDEAVRMAPDHAFFLGSGLLCGCGSLDVFLSSLLHKVRSRVFEVEAASCCLALDLEVFPLLFIKVKARDVLAVHAVDFPRRE